MFAGLLCLTPGSLPEDVADAGDLGRRLAPFHRPDREGIWQRGPALLLAQRTFNAAASRDRELPLRCPRTGIALAFWGRLDNRETLAASLHIKTSLDELLDSELVLAAWHRWGEHLPERLVGDFALAVMDAERRSVFVARDTLGIKPLYYREDERALAFASSAAALRGLRGAPPVPDREWMARFTLHLSGDVERTAFRDIRKLPPGHALYRVADGNTRLWRWHEWRDDSPDAIRRDPAWVDRYRAVLEEAIRCRLPSDYALGTENSGGIDSATVTAYLARFIGRPGNRLHSFAFAMAEQEPALILETSQASGIVHNYVVTALSHDEAEQRQLRQRTLQVLGHPEEHGNGSGHTPFYREAQARDIRTLYSGFGGDEVVTNPGGHVRQEMLDAGRYGILQELLPGNALSRRLRVLKMIAQRQRGRDYNPGFLAAWTQRWPQFLLRDEVVAEFDLREAYFATAAYDAPYRRTNDFIVQHLLRQSYIAQRFESCTLAAASWGIEYRWPLWDARLVQQYLSTPSIEKRGPRNMGRYLHRRAIDGVVPASVAWKPSKDMGSPVIQLDAAATLGNVRRQLRAGLQDWHPAVLELLDRKRAEALCTDSTAPRAGAHTEIILSRHVGHLQMLSDWLHSTS